MNFYDVKHTKMYAFFFFKQAWKSSPNPTPKPKSHMLNEASDQYSMLVIIILLKKYILYSLASFVIVIYSK